MPRVTKADLLFAKDWIETFQGEGDEPASVQRLCAWLEGLIQQRERDEVIRAGAKAYGKTLPQARAAYKRAQTRLRTQDAPTRACKDRADG